jgi:hypothetical protein
MVCMHSDGLVLWALILGMCAALIAQGNSHVSTWDILGTLIPAFDQTLWELQPLPASPGNLTAYQGTFIASAFLEYASGQPQPDRVGGTDTHLFLPTLLQFAGGQRNGRSRRRQQPAAHLHQRWRCAS